MRLIDADKVIEQLNEEKELSYADFDKYVYDVCPGFDSEYDDFFHKGLERAIELIKVCSSKYLRSQDKLKKSSCDGFFNFYKSPPAVGAFRLFCLYYI